MKILSTIIILVIAMSVTAYAQLKLKFEQYKLPNGLAVILHEDHKAPVVAVEIMYHVGSKNEKVKRTGFAHLFEHMMFQGSEHVAKTEHFSLLQEVGANINGSTNDDVTNYFEVVPSNYVELALYLESDRMGFLVPAMTQDKLDNQRDVVKNERRQNVDNRPYGTADEKIAKALYPATHPYSWPVIGYMEDLSAAALDDVKDFFRTHYAPNNAVLVLCGDFKADEVKPLIGKYFATIPRGKPIERPIAPKFAVEKEQRMVYEDRVQLPRLYLTWHSVKEFTRENAVLDVLGDILSSGKTSRLYKPMVYEDQIAQSVRAGQDGSEIDGTFSIQVTAKPEKTLTQMEKAVDEVLGELLRNGVKQEEIDHALASTEVRIINRAQTVLGKASTFATIYSVTGDPKLINKQLDLYKGITPKEVLAAAKKYLTPPRIVLSIVPNGKTELAAQKGN